MQWLDGDGAARILDIDGLTILMEWLLDGLTLGEMVRREGDDDGATGILGGVLRQLQHPRANLPALRSLRQQFEALFAAQPDDWPVTHRPRAARGGRRTFATELFATTTANISAARRFSPRQPYAGALAAGR